MEQLHDGLLHGESQLGDLQLNEHVRDRDRDHNGHHDRDRDHDHNGHHDRLGLKLAIGSN